MMLKLKCTKFSAAQTDTTGPRRVSDSFDALIDVPLIFRLKTAALQLFTLGGRAGGTTLTKTSSCVEEEHVSASPQILRCMMV